MSINLKIVPKKMFGEDAVSSLLVFLPIIYLASQINMYSVFRCILGILYPAYSSYKAMRTKDRRLYVRWMMYWIVFAAFTMVEIVADVTIGYITPFYSIMKLLFLAWMSSSVTRGSNIIFRHFIYPRLVRHEGKIDNTIGSLDVHLLYASKYLLSVPALIKDALETSNAAVATVDNGEDHVDGSEWVDEDPINLSHDNIDSHSRDDETNNISGHEWIDDDKRVNLSDDIIQPLDDEEEDDEEITDLSHDFFDDFDVSSHSVNVAYNTL